MCTRGVDLIFLVRLVVSRRHFLPLSRGPHLFFLSSILIPLVCFFLAFFQIPPVALLCLVFAFLVPSVLFSNGTIVFLITRRISIIVRFGSSSMRLLVFFGRRLASLELEWMTLLGWCHDGANVCWFVCLSVCLFVCLFVFSFLFFCFNLPGSIKKVHVLERGVTLSLFRFWDWAASGSHYV